MKTIHKINTPPGVSNKNLGFQGASYSDEALFNLWQINIEQGFAPIDPVTGLPLPIAPADTPDSVPNEKLLLDNHHVWYWRTHEDLMNTSGKVVRHSRLIRGPRWAHERYHCAFNNGLAWLPSTRHEKFYIGVMACSGIVPEYGIDVSDKKPTVIKLGQKALEHLKSPKVIFPEKSINRLTHHDDYLKRRGVFFMQYALDHGFDAVDVDLLAQFTEEKEESLRRSLGMQVISAYVRSATTPIVEPYAEAKDKGLLPPAQPRNPARLVNEITGGYWVQYLDTVSVLAKERLAAA